MWGGHEGGVGPALGLAGYLKCLQQLSCVKKAMRQECTEPCAQRPDTRGTGMAAAPCGAQVILSLSGPGFLQVLWSVSGLCPQGGGFLDSVNEDTL